MSHDEQNNDRRLGTKRVGGRPIVNTNPLERSVDVTERRLHRLLVLLAIALLPVVFIPGALIWQTRDDTARPVTSTVLATTDASAKPVTPITSTIGADDMNKVAAHWQWAGERKNGVITVAPGTDANTRIPITVDENGNPSPAMPMPADAGVTAVMVVVVLLGVLIAMLLAAMAWVRRRYDQKRDVLWDEAIHRFFS